MFNFFANRRKTKAAQAACDAFNARHRIGTPVIVRHQLIETMTASPARVVACNAVIDLHFKGGSILLEVPLEKVVPQPQQIAEPALCEFFASVCNALTAQDMRWQQHAGTTTECAVAAIEKLGAQHQIAEPASQAAKDVLAERQRQISAEGWTPEHDDKYHHGDMASAAACYAREGRFFYPDQGKPSTSWPLPAEWWKPTSYRRNLVKAGALILAELERIDRAATPKEPS